MFGVPMEHWMAFWAVAARVGGVVALAPVLGARFVPGIARVGLTLAISFALWPAVAVPALPGDALGYSALILAEAVTGLAIGLMSKMAFVAVQSMGALLDLDLGFGAANLLNPASNEPLPLLSNFMNLFATVVYLAVNAHYVLAEALALSFRQLPLGMWLGSAFAHPLVDAFVAAFTSAMQLAIPVMAASFLITVALAVLSRAVPQMNVFLLGLPVKMAVGVGGLALMLPIYTTMLKGLFPADAAALLGHLGG